LDKLPLKVRARFKYKIPIFKCSNAAVKYWKIIENNGASIQDLSTARQLTGIAFFLAGCAICSGIMDILAARLLALMLLLFEGFVEIPPIFSRLHSQPTWGAAVYNVTAIGACRIFAEFLASRADRGRIGAAGNVAKSRPDTVVA
jgi:hypothetical protein